MNPYVLLVAVLALMGAAGGGYRFGVTHERGEAALRLNEAAIAAADKARADAVFESERALASAKAAAARRAAARDRQHQLEMEIARDETALKCRISDGTLRVLSLAIDAANGPEAETAPAGVPATPTPNRADGFRPDSVDRGFFGNLWRLPSFPQTLNGLDKQ